MKRLLKGIFRERPTLPKYTVTFDVDIVFTYLQGLPHPESVALKELSMRVATILCILSGQRSQTLSVLSTTFINHPDNKIIFPITSLLKQSRPDYHQEPLEFLVYDKDPRICPVSNIKLYIENTKDIRGEERGLFISYVPPHKAVSSKTIARWVSSFLQDSGVDPSYGAHSTRSASTSKALKLGMSLADIGRAAGWTSASVFRRHYKKPINNNLGSQLLNAL